MQAVEKRSLAAAESEADRRKLVGSPIRRSEDLRLLTGKDQYIDNLKIPEMVFAGFVRSPYARAKIVKIDLSPVLGNPDVVAILTPEEVKRDTYPVPVLWKVHGSKVHEHYALAQENVNHVGDPVVAIAVRDRYSLEDVLESIDVKYEPLEPVLDPLKAPGKQAIHEDLGTNLCYELPISSGNIEKALKESDLVLSKTFKISRLAASPMETRGVIAVPGGMHSALTIYSSTQWPHVLRMLLSSCLRMDENNLRVIGPDVGGAFGVKGEVYGEEIAVALLARKCGLAVKWIESRKESFLATTHARDQVIDSQAGFTKDGILRGLKVKLVCDCGAYLHTITLGSGLITAISFNGPYHVPNFSATASAVYTNKTGLSAYRGFGQPEAAFVVERLMSEAARKLGLDQSEIRFRNLVSAREMPYTTCSGGVIDSGDYPGLFRKALDLANYEDLIRERDVARRRGKLRGIGISFFVETTGFAPGFVFEHLGLELGGYDSATVRVDSHGKATVTTGAFPHGQGFNTALAQICADELGLKFEDVFAFHGDTSSSPFGQGSFGSRTVAVAGSAAVRASRELALKIKRLGAHMMKLDEDAAHLSLSDGFVKSKNDRSKVIPVSEVARAAYIAHDMPSGMDPGLEATAYFSPAGLATSYAAHIVDVEVDRESGKVRILKQIGVHDCGKEINPLIVDGQVHGGIAQAIGASFLEEISYDDNGQLLSASFLDYLLPCAENMPVSLAISSTSVPTPINPLGSKGVGESGTITATPAFANAVADATGFDVDRIPMTPERVWRMCVR